MRTEIIAVTDLKHAQQYSLTQMFPPEDLGRLDSNCASLQGLTLNVWGFHIRARTRISTASLILL